VVGLLVLKRPAARVDGSKTADPAMGLGY